MNHIKEFLCSLQDSLKSLNIVQQNSFMKHILLCEDRMGFVKAVDGPPKGADIWEAKDSNGNLVKDEAVVTVAFAESQSRLFNLDEASGILVVWNRDNESVTVLDENITVAEASKRLF